MHPRPLDMAGRAKGKLEYRMGVKNSSYTNELRIKITGQVYQEARNRDTWVSIQMNPEPVTSFPIGSIPNFSRFRFHTLFFQYQSSAKSGAPLYLKIKSVHQFDVAKCSVTFSLKSLISVVILFPMDIIAKAESLSVTRVLCTKILILFIEKN